MAKLAEILTAVKSEGGAKTAAVSPTPASGRSASASTPSDASLKTALLEVLQPNAEKSAAAPNTTPIADLERVASQVASAEHEAIIKEAMIYGAAVADGAMARFAQYDEAARKLGHDTTAPAATKVAGDDTFQKFAEQNPDLVQQAAEVGYHTANRQIEQLKQAAHNRGYESGVLAIYKTASETYVRGFEDLGRVIEAARSTK